MNPKKLFSKLRFRKSSRSITGQQSSADPKYQTITPDDLASSDVHATSIIDSASVGSSIPSQTQGQHLQRVSHPSAPTNISAEHPPTPTELNTTSALTENVPGWGATAYGGVKMVLEVVRESSDVFVPLKSAVGGLAALLKQYDQFIANKDDVRRVILRVESLTTSLTGPPPENDLKEIERRRILGIDLRKVLDMLDPMLNQSAFSGFLNNADQAGKITGVVEDIRNAIIDYQTSIQQGLNENTITITESVLFDKLPRAKGARYESGDRQKCLRGTRVGVLEAIENWVQGHRSRRVYWLNGVAGTGKTTIAQSFAERMFAEGLLGASFFCSRDFPDRRDLHFIFPTLAFQLAYRYPKFRAQLVQVLTTNPDVGHESLSNQLNKLLVDPLRLTGLSTVIVVDALDECEDDEPASAILSLLSRAIDHIPLVKFFITGRPEPQIRSGFRLPTLRPQTEILLLHEVERGNVDEDIKLFLEYRLKELVENRSDMDITTPWPTPEDIQIVISKAGGLFIYASTVIKFVASAGHTPQECLWMVISMPDSSYEGSSGIDPLYTRVIEISSHVHGSGFDYFSRLLLVISSVVLLCEPVSVASLASLLGIGPKAILSSIRSLHSVLLVPDSDSKPIRVFHKSFPDYITNHERCKDSRFCVDPPVHHARLAIKCFELMIARLKKNICDMPQYSMNDDIKDLSIRREESIGEVLVYACRFWAKHVCSTSMTGGDVACILDLLNKFIRRHLLQWLEVLSIVNDLRGAVHSFDDVERWIIGVKCSDRELLESIRECRRFILYSFDGIEQSAAHIYDSILFWPPASSLIWRLYSDQLTTQVKVVNAIGGVWDACIRSIRLGDRGWVPSVAFSHRGNLIVGCNGSVVKILEAATGVCLATLNGHSSAVNSVAFSLDDVFLASGSQDATVRIWDVQTGALVAVFEKDRGSEENRDSIRSVAFSPIGTIVAWAAVYQSIGIWDFSSGDCTHILIDHPGGIRSVCWLRANEVVSGYNDGKVKVWNVSSGQCLKTFDQDSGDLNAVACPPDASKIASGHNDKIHVYDTRTGDTIQTFVPDEVVQSICFSPDGGKIVYATAVSVVVWDLVREVVTARWPSATVSVAYSPDGSCVATGSWNEYVKVFQIDTGSEDDVCDQRSGDVLCISCSTDGRVIATGSQDKAVRIWDGMTGSCVHTFHGHTNWISSVAISPDSSLVASACYNAAIRIWSLHDPSTITTLTGVGSATFGLRFSPDGRQMVSVSYSNDITLWDVEKWEKLAVWFSPDRGEFPSEVSCSTDGTQVILKFGDGLKKWNILPRTEDCFQDATEISPDAKLDSPSEDTPLLPMVLVPIPNDVHTVPQDDVRSPRYRSESGWITDERGRRLCWIPADRGRYSKLHGERMILGTTIGTIVIVDLSDVSVPLGS